MKRRITPILTITVALVLLGSLAYAAKKKELSKSQDPTPEPMHEEEALKAELLEAARDREDKSHSIGDASAKKIIHASSFEKTEAQLVKQPKK